MSTRSADRDGQSGRLLRRGRILEGLTLGSNVVGVVVLGIAALAARSVALAGFGFDSLIEIGASAVVLWELSGTGMERQRHALRLIGAAFAALACYLAIKSTIVFVAHDHPRHSSLGIVWTALTALAMFALAAGKDRTGRQLGNPVLRTEGRVTLVDGLLATAVLAGLVLMPPSAGGGLIRSLATCSWSTARRRAGQPCILNPLLTRETGRQRPQPPARLLPEGAAHPAKVGS